jgi:hypothetical protein
MSLYNLTQLQQATTMGKLVIYANNASDGYLILFFIIAMFFIMFMALKRYDFGDAILVSSFISFILSLVASFGGFLNMLYPLGFLIVTAIIGLIVFAFKKD